jgi:integrase
VIQQYRNQLVLAGYRPMTVRYRIRCVRDFAAHLAPRTLQEAHRADVEAFLARPLAAESRRCYRSHLRAFYAWALEEGHVSEDPTVKVAPIRVKRGAPRPIGADDLAEALQRAPARMRAWLLLMALGGLRACEVARLRPTDLLISDGVALLWLRETKGGGTATVPAHPAIVEALAALPVIDGRWWKACPQYVSQTVSTFLRACGIDATGHQLRHFAGTAWYRASQHDLLVTARLLRHVNAATTQTYAQFDPTRPAEVVRLVPMPGAAVS